MNRKIEPPPAEDWDDTPEWTDEMIARARPATEVHGKEAAKALVRKGRPKLADADRKQPVSIRLSADLLERLRATGPGWQTRVDDLLRAALDFDSSKGPLGAPTSSRDLAVALAMLKLGVRAKAAVSNDGPSPRTRRTVFDRMVELSRAAASGEVTKTESLGGDPLSEVPASNGHKKRA